MNRRSYTEKRVENRRRAPPTQSGDRYSGVRSNIDYDVKRHLEKSAKNAENRDLFDTVEAKHEFIEGVLAEFSAKEAVHLTTGTYQSTWVQRLLKQAGPVQVHQWAVKLWTDIGAILRNQSGSPILEHIIDVFTGLLGKNAYKPAPLSLLESLVELIMDRPSYFMSHQNSSYVVKRLIPIMAEHFPEQLKQFQQGLLSGRGEDDDVERSVLTFCMSPSASKVIAACVTHSDVMLRDIFEHIDELVLHDSGSIVVEALCTAGYSSEVSKRIDIAGIASHHAGCFVVKAILKSAKSRKVIKSTIMAVLTNFERIYSSGGARFDLCKVVCEAAGKFRIKSAQKEIADFFRSRFSARDNMASAILATGRKKGRMLASDKGSYIVQALLSFQYKNFEELFQSFANMESEHLLRMAVHFNASFAVEKFFKCQIESSVPNSVVRSVIDKLQPKMVGLIVDSKGSRIFEAVWERMNIAQRDQTMKQLTENDSMILDSRVGVIVARKIGYGDYRNNPNEWRNKQNKGKRIAEALERMEDEVEVEISQRKRKAQQGKYSKVQRVYSNKSEE
ncbi:hypothetical protein PCE1_001899 [Barthelona sp. PCE]